jgi:hypothetical protein
MELKGKKASESKTGEESVDDMRHDCDQHEEERYLSPACTNNQRMPRKTRTMLQVSSLNVGIICVLIIYLHKTCAGSMGD